MHKGLHTSGPRFPDNRLRFSLAHGTIVMSKPRGSFPARGMTPARGERRCTSSAAEEPPRVRACLSVFAKVHLGLS